MWRGGRKLAQVVAATLLDYLCAFSRLQTVRDYMRIVFCLAAQRRLLSAAALELHDDQFGMRRERRERKVARTTGQLSSYVRSFFYYFFFCFFLY